jgi:hypothetical protein
MNILKNELMKPLQWLRLSKKTGPLYYALYREGDKEIRKYRPFLVAQTEVKGSMLEAIAQGQQRLERYVAGENESGQELRHMNSWFFARTKRPGYWMVAAALDPDFNSTSLPLPLNSNIRTLRIPSLWVAVKRFSGKNAEDTNEEAALDLRHWLEQRVAYQVVSEPRWTIAEGMLPSISKKEIHLTLQHSV